MMRARRWSGKTNIIQPLCGLAPQNLTANCLCAKHNSALHPLDDAAKFFFASLRSYLEVDAGSRHAIVSGHDVERWLLKTAKAAAVAKNLAMGREPLSRAFSRDEAILARGRRALLSYERRRYDAKSRAFLAPASYE
jgi:hypothetical protein